MRTFDQEYEIFFENYKDVLENLFTPVHNSVWFRGELQSIFNNAKRTRGNRYTITAFFRDVKNTILDVQENYDSIDIINFLASSICEDEMDDSDENRSILQDYFDDVKQAYKSIEDDSLEFCEENREAILKSNLKLVISIAKRYQNRGLSFEDLIGAGNVGLCVAWDRYKPERNILRTKILSELKNCPEQISKDYIDSLLNPLVKYGDIKEKYNEYFHSSRIYDREEVLKWVNKNIRKAKFSSVAQLWIRAYIFQELDSKSRIVKKPKREIDRDFELTGSYLKEHVISINPYPDAESNTTNTPRIEISTIDDTEERIDEQQNLIDFKINLNHLLKGINNRDRRILFKSFGIGLPRSMEPREIAETESLSVARVSQIILDSITKMKENASELDLTMNDLIKYLR